MNDFLLEANQKQILFKRRVIQDSIVYLQKFMTVYKESQRAKHLPVFGFTACCNHIVSQACQNFIFIHH